jgi:predicted RNA-binding protein with PIN domain
MPLARILVDGYSLLHHWPELAPGHPRYSEAARDELINRLRQYGDAVGTPITVFFDGSGPRGRARPVDSTPELEILYSHTGQTADDMIERTAVRLRPYGEVLVVTNDFAERDTVFYHGALSASCENFIDDMEEAARRQGRDIVRHNRQEQSRFKAPK